MSIPITRVVLAARPTEQLTTEHFRIESATVAPPRDGEVLVRLHYLSVDPYMLRLVRGQIDYPPNVAPGDAMFGRAVGEVVESRSPDYAAGDAVFLWSRWQTQTCVPATDLRRIDIKSVPATAYLGVLGHSALTAWAGLLDIGRPVAGETVLVSAAAGAVGSVAGQIAKIHGCRVVGIAGGGEKCRHVVDTLGFDACVDYRAPDFEKALAEAAPRGVDVHFENVGSHMLDAALPLMNRHGRMVICGLLAEYLGSGSAQFKNFSCVLNKALRIEAFSISDYLTRSDEAMQQLSQWLADGRLKYRETVAEGIASAPQALVDLLSGRNIGKQLVRLS